MENTVPLTVRRAADDSATAAKPITMYTIAGGVFLGLCGYSLVSGFVYGLYVIVTHS